MATAGNFTSQSVPERIVAIQALRLLAAFAVLLSHAQGQAYGLGRAYDLYLDKYIITIHGAAGVDLFFVISGFIMVHSSRPLFGSGNGRRTFLVRRMIRIIPLYWLATALLVAWRARLGAAPDATYILASLGFVPYSSDGPSDVITPFLNPGWTLYFEMLFYLVFAACLANCARKTVMRTAAILVAFVLAGSLFDLPWPAAAFAHPILLEFIAGMLLALAVQRGIAFPAAARWGALAAAAIVFTLYAGIASNSAFGWARVLGYGVPALLVLVAVTTGKVALPRPRLWNFGGDISYALYLFHLPLLIVARFAWNYLGLPYDADLQWLFIALAVLASLVASAAIYLAVDRPLTRFLRGIFNPRPARQELSVSGV